MNKPLHSIPNRAGFVLDVRDQSGKWHRTVVTFNEKNENYYLDLPPGVLWSSLIDWREVGQ